MAHHRHYGFDYCQSENSSTDKSISTPNVNQTESENVTEYVLTTHFFHTYNEYTKFNTNAHVLLLRNRHFSARERYLIKFKIKSMFEPIILE